MCITNSAPLVCGFCCNSQMDWFWGMQSGHMDCNCTNVSFCHEWLWPLQVTETPDIWVISRVGNDGTRQQPSVSMRSERSKVNRIVFGDCGTQMDPPQFPADWPYGTTTVAEVSLGLVNILGFSSPSHFNLCSRVLPRGPDFRG